MPGRRGSENAALRGPGAGARRPGAGARVALVLLQAGGAVGLLAYPAILLSTVMAVAAPGQGLRATVVRGASSLVLLYPVAWGLLFWASWRALGRGRTALALALSTPPLAATLVGAALLASSSHRAASIVKEYEAGWLREARRVGEESSLAGALLLFERGEVSREELLEAVRKADASELSRPAERRPVAVPGVTVTRTAAVPADQVRKSTPLAIALGGSALAKNLATVEPDPLLDAARALLARGARLSPEEEAGEPRLAWLAEVVERGTALPDRTAEAENPLAWVIATAPRGEEPRVASAIYAAARREPELLRRPTTTYGTPLRAALLVGRSDRARDLLRSGALLSAEERLVPSVVRDLERFLALPVNEEVRGIHDANLARERPAGRAGP